MTFIERVNQLESLAFKIISDLKIKKPPIDIKKIVTKLGLDLVDYNLGGEASGILVITNNKGTIGCNPADNQQRQRFTIAHELGHYLLHKSSSELFVDKDFLVKYRNSTSSNSYTPAELRHESEANAFAAALLMPRSFIEEYMKKKEFEKLDESQLIKKLAKEFDVSDLAMTYRLSNFNTNYLNG